MNEDVSLFAQSSAGVPIHGAVRTLTRFTATLEVFDPDCALQASEALQTFDITRGDESLYSGKAVVQRLINTGSALMCEIGLSEEGWTDLPPSRMQERELKGEFNSFVKTWERFYRVEPEYKLVIADIESFLADLRLWVNRLEVRYQNEPASVREEIELDYADKLRGPVGAALTSMFERFECLCDRIEPERHPVHRAFGQRRLHPYLLCSPFIHRTFAKPLGYAGDYEMMNMICRHKLEGNSLFAKLVNSFLLDQVGPEAVRNRVGFLKRWIGEETGRIARKGRRAHIYSIACGPAREAREFLEEHPLANQSHFHLLDFNEETLRHTGERMEEIRRRLGLSTPVEFVRNSVQNLLRANSKSVREEPRYDLIYCSGLYDYLNDRIIKALNTYLYDRLLPGGLLVVGNFAPNTPVRNFIEHFLEWFLIYRDSKQLEALSPEQAAPEDCRVACEPTTTNIFLEVRKPARP